VRRGRKLHDPDEILERIVGQLVVEAGIDREGAGDELPGTACCIAAAMMRAMMSEGPPGVLATMIRTARSG
jgi:hypothetical protein